MRSSPRSIQRLTVLVETERRSAKVVMESSWGTRLDGWFMSASSALAASVFGAASSPILVVTTWRWGASNDSDGLQEGRWTTAPRAHFSRDGIIEAPKGYLSGE